MKPHLHHPLNEDLYIARCHLPKIKYYKFHMYLVNSLLMFYNHKKDKYVLFSISIYSFCFPNFSNFFSMKTPIVETMNPCIFRITFFIGSSTIVILNSKYPIRITNTPIKKYIFH